MKLHLPTKGNWFSRSGRPLVIAGPCSAESPLQMLEVASSLSRIDSNAVLRAGIWKPRTRPGSFEGAGELGLPWLVDAGKQFNLPVTTEVANAEHVELCLKAGVDVLWIGARTVVNPFSVQEIANALKGTQIPVLVKNPIHPDIDLWIGAIERLRAVGLHHIAAVHRGFHVYGKKQFRNDPKWEIPISLMDNLPEIPLLCDPSHIAGKRGLVAGVSQKAMDLGMSGLMVEVHPNPDLAKSDAKQQITPEDFGIMLSHLKIRSIEESVSLQVGALDKLRERIDLVDADLIHLLAERIALSREIGELKKEKNMAILQIRRWKKIIRNQLKNGELLGVDEDFVKAVYQLIHEESIRVQGEIMNKRVEPLKEWRA